MGPDTSAVGVRCESVYRVP